jgi:Ca2+-binding RTX toxin-like protein
MTRSLRRLGGTLLGSALIALITGSTAMAAPPAPCTITGTQGDDVLRGTPGRDVICGLAGDDRIDARGGDDVLRGGAGNDQLYGGPGDDRIHPGSGDDTVIADPIRADVPACASDDLVDCRFDLTWDTSECGEYPYGEGSYSCVKSGRPTGTKGFTDQTLFGWTGRPSDGWVRVGVYADPTPNPDDPDKPDFGSILNGWSPSAASEKLFVKPELGGFVLANEWRSLKVGYTARYGTLEQPGKAAGQPGAPLYIDVENTCTPLSIVCGMHVHIWGFLHRLPPSPPAAA